MQSFNPAQLFRQVHIKMFNPPYTQLGFRAQDDPDQLRKRAHEAISAGAPEQFVQWVQHQVSDWEHSDLCLHLMGQAMKVAGHPQEARGYLTRALAYRRADGAPLQIASTLLGLSEVARFVDNIDEAWQHLNEAVSIYPCYRSAHLNRLCLASLSKDETHLRTLFEEMCTMYPDWSKDEALCRGLRDDGELQYLRESELWHTIEAHMLASSLPSSLRMEHGIQ